MPPPAARTRAKLSPMSSPAAHDDTFAMRTAAAAQLAQAADRLREVDARAPALVASVRWRSPGFDAFRRGVDGWADAVRSLERAVRSAAEAVPFDRTSPRVRELPLFPVEPAR